jgi:hypothetical protein
MPRMSRHATNRACAQDSGHDVPPTSSAKAVLAMISMHRVAARSPTRVYIIPRRAAGHRRACASRSRRSQRALRFCGDMMVGARMNY